jgi:uncharacterized protein YukE
LKELQRIIASQERIEGRFSALHAEVKAEVQEMRAAVTTVKEEVQQVRAEVTAEVQQVRAEVTAELQQMGAEVQVWRAEMEKWRAEMEKTVRTVELKEAQLRTQILGTAEGLVSINQPFIVLTETKFSYRYIPVWARYSPHRTRVEAHANMLSP